MKVTQQTPALNGVLIKKSLDSSFDLASAPIDESLDVSFDLAASEGQFCEFFGQMCIKCEVQKGKMRFNFF